VIYAVCKLHYQSQQYFENTIFILKIKNTILFCIFKILFEYFISSKEYAVLGPWIEMTKLR